VNSTISGNSAKTSGGGISGGVTVENSTISGNSAGMSGGGISGSTTIENSTISGNSAGTSGGGIYNNSSLDVTLSTITGNSAPSGGGVYNVGSVEVFNTILNAGASGENIFNDGGTVTSLGYNLSSDDGGGYLNGPGDQINTDPLLGPCRITVVQPLRMRCCPAAQRLTPAIRLHSATFHRSARLFFQSRVQWSHRYRFI
jgi:predicted outer membrane repeat protein